MDSNVKALLEVAKESHFHLCVYTPGNLGLKRQRAVVDAVSSSGSWSCLGLSVIGGQVATLGFPLSAGRRVTPMGVQTVASPPALGSLCTLPLHLVQRAGRWVFFPRPFSFRLALPLSCDAASGVQESWVLRHSKLMVESAAGDGLAGIWH